MMETERDRPLLPLLCVLGSLYILYCKVFVCANYEKAIKHALLCFGFLLLLCYSLSHELRDDVKTSQVSDLH